MDIVLKLTGALLVVGSCGIYAREFTCAMQQRERQLKQLYSILIQLKSELKYMNSTLPECFASLAGHVAEPFCEWFGIMADKMNEERTCIFADIWEGQLVYLLENSRLNEGDIELLSELRDKLGTADTEAASKAVDYTSLRLEDRRRQLTEEMNMKKKMVFSLCMFAGFITVILLF